MSAVVSSPDPRAHSSLTGILLEFLGSMNLAITLLVVVGIASVIGMVLQQGQSYGDYLLQFGPFWFQVFSDLGLYNVYSAGWFVFILAFLMVSTSVCIVRNGPGMLREMRQFRMNVQAKSLRLMRHHVERETVVGVDAVRARAERLLRNHGYRVRESAESRDLLLAGMNGASNRLGYLLTHIGLVVILLSGVIDGNLPLQITMAMHGLRVETKDIPASKVPSSSRLAPGTLAFRGDVSIPVGSTTDVLFLNMYQESILAGAALVLIGLGCHWRPMQLYSLVVAALSLFGIALYGQHFSAGHSDPLLAWWLSSPAAIAWSCGLFLLATLVYLFGLVARDDGLSVRSLAWGSWLTWAAVTMGFVALMVRWRESYLFGPGFGQIPISDLFDVFVLFNVITGLLYLYYESRYRQRALGSLALTIISAAALFTIFLMFKFHGANISAVNPELRSYWIKIHVPALFVGYGAFAFGAMVGAAYLLRLRVERLNPEGRIARRLPDFALLDDVMYRYNALGFTFLTLGTILGALWAEQAWGARTGRGIRRRPKPSSSGSTMPRGCTCASPRAGMAIPWRCGRSSAWC